ncbi:MAG: phosphomannomutase CpsG [Porticoccus sp.]
MKIDCFKAYDIRGKLDDELTPKIVYRIGRAYARWLSPTAVVVGGDVRNSSATLKSALTDGLRDEGVHVIDIGLCGTEEIYFATNYFGVDGGIMVTASHNPIDYNGLKLVREHSKPVSSDTGLLDIRKIAEEGIFLTPEGDALGSCKKISCFDAYIAHLLTYIDDSKLKPLKIVINSGNGGAGKVLDALEPHLPFEFIKIHHEPDGAFPNGIPNPLLLENRYHTTNAIRKHKADFGIAWDGDFDRCFLFDESGEFIEGYYVVGLLAEAFLRKLPNEKIIHDPRLFWNTQAICKDFSGTPVQSKCGHSFMKQAMRKEDAVYGGEMSAHHYFRDFFYCDSGMIPWLLTAELLGVSGKSLSSMVKSRMEKYPCSGEINREIKDVTGKLNDLEIFYNEKAVEVDHFDGLSMIFEGWRFNLRSSNTEPVVRLNVEAITCELMESKTEEILRFL